MRDTEAMLPEGVQILTDGSVGAWIEPRLGGEFGAVTRALPKDYEAYARILHPIEQCEGELKSWAEVAKATGRQVHPLVQWHALVGSPDSSSFTGSLWHGEVPDRGNLVPEALGPLCGVLSGHTTTAANCCFGVWVGHGWITDEERAPFAAHPPARASPSNLRHSLLKLPGRDFLLLKGPLRAATEVGSAVAPSAMFPGSPNLFWPADHAWCVASEIDFDSTLVGGSKALIKALLDDPGFEAFEVQPGSSLAADADLVNPVPPWEPDA